MRASYDECEEYLANVAAFMERSGIVLHKPAEGEDLELYEDEAGALSFELIGAMADDDGPGGAKVQVREELRPIGADQFQTSRYEYELIDVAGDYRRAFHLHDSEQFQRDFLVVVHEHCERPLGRTACRHYAGPPIKDSYAGVTILIDAWVAAPPDCSALLCLG